MRHDLKWVWAVALVFVVLFAAAGAGDWRKEQRLEAAQIACLKNHPVSECKELK
jgi:hypothetical protein